MNNKHVKRIIAVIILVIIIIFLLKGCACSKEDVITLSGEKVITLEYGQEFDPNIIKIKKNGKEINETPEVDLSKVDFKKLGKYPITIRYIDQDGNILYEEERYIEIKDTTPPEIVLKGSNPLTIPINTEYNDAGFVVTDNYDRTENIKVTRKTDVDTSEPGTYYVTYTATDTSGNQSSITRKVIVEKEQIITDDELIVIPPVTPPTKPIVIGVTTLQLNGTSTMYIEYGNTYSEPGYKATDTVDGNITSKVKVTGTVNTSKIGTYKVTYSVTNSGGKTTTVTREVIVRDTVPPVLSLVGDNPILLERHATYIEPGVTATDNYDGDITSKVIVTNSINTTLVGSQYLVYQVSDSSGNLSTIQREVIIYEPIVVKKDPNMIPIRYDSNKWVKADEANEDASYYWFDYQDKMWANVATVNASKLDYYQDAPIGTDVVEADITGYFVYIPRFRYKIQTVTTVQTGTLPSSNFISSINPTMFEIEFENTILPKSVATGVNQWHTHPAFTLVGDTSTTELEGFWVGKFETSKTSASTPLIDSATALSNGVYVKPNQYSLRNMPANDMFITALELKKPQYLNMAELETRMQRNSEWGAISYLSYSQYGICLESGCGTLTVDKNDRSTYTTGCGNQRTPSCLAYDTSEGLLASTTHNIYGIYDMNGGAFETVLGFFNKGVASSGLDLNLIDSKYFDNYPSSVFNGNTYTNMSRCTIATCGGHAMFETAGWNGNVAIFPDPTDPIIARGGYVLNTGTQSGLWYVYPYAGNGVNTRGFRLIISDY